MNVAGKSQGQKWLRLNAHIKRERQFLCKMQMTLDLNSLYQRDEEGNWNRFIYTAFTKKNCLLVSGKYLFQIQTKWCHFAFNPERPPPFSFHFLHFSFILFKVKQQLILYNRAVFCVTYKASLYKEMDTDVWDGRSDGTALARMCLGYSLQGKKNFPICSFSGIIYYAHRTTAVREREPSEESRRAHLKRNNAAAIAAGLGYPENFHFGNLGSPTILKAAQDEERIIGKNWLLCYGGARSRQNPF